MGHTMWSSLRGAAGVLCVWIACATPASSQPAPPQKPLVDPQSYSSNHQANENTFKTTSPPPWTLDFASSAPHLFASISHLLHQWSNTVFPNGHTLAAVQIPAYTLLYHGLIASPGEAHPEPPSPEWLALDLEMAYGIMGSSRDSFLLTYQATQPIKALYFDGESATLMGSGQMDTQMLQVWGNISGPASRGDGRRGGFGGLGDEYARAHGLCTWLEEAGLRGPGWGFEGVVRMNAGFEMIWCDFLSRSLRLVSRLNVTAPLLPEEKGGVKNAESAGAQMSEDEDSEPSQDDLIKQPELQKRGLSASTTAETSAAADEGDETTTSYYPLPPQPTKTDHNAQPTHGSPPPNMRWGAGREPFLRIQGWGWFDSATWHYGSNRNGPGLGETKAKVLNCGILSYYSPQFVNQTGNRALLEQDRLNLTSEGRWTGPDEHGSRAKAIKELARRRRLHHLENVTPKEARLMKINSERALRSILPDESSCSGADWTLMTSEIVQHVTNQLTMLNSALELFPRNTSSTTAIYHWLYDLRAQSHIFLVAYMQYPQEITHETWQTDSMLYKQTYARCQYRYTRLLMPDSLQNSLSPEEQDARWAVEEVYGAICAVLITMGFGIELEWLNMLQDEHEAGTRLASRAAIWQDNIAELTAWLGWESEYYGCQEQCAWNERCYIPMWPMIHHESMGGGPGRGPGGRRPGNGTRGGRGSGRRPGDGGGTGPGPGPEMSPRGPAWTEDDSDLWEPKCVNITWIMGER
ncbi:hypothetical protein BD289DRAFT_440852 [Coniella lustricola]|uniref:Uncharacterized protein n=1 Tax=Coniella lustricola TaxID=2025994 RepID=A0A2T3A075_9PEZI|nr:hypothetical protein BD289DRAFT_440852 [Coniella lustricola]